MTTPKYQLILANSIPKILEEKAEISIIAGNYKNQYGVASTFSPIELYIIKLLSDASLQLDFPKNYNTMILVLEGEVNINNQNLETKELIIFNNDATDIKIITNQKGARLLILSAEPINEPIAHYGPFVMNESSELIKAIEDFNSGKFGKLN